MFRIRKGCFETNSSSTHTIVVSCNNNDNYWDIAFFRIGNFGWEMDVLNDDWKRASYFYTAACDLLGRDVKDDIIALLSPLGINCVFDEEYAPIFVEYGTDGNTYLDNGSVDHVEDCADFVNDMMNDGEALARFIFNNESFVITGNDNCDDIDAEWMTKKELKAASYPHKTYYKGN